MITPADSTTAQVHYRTSFSGWVVNLTWKGLLPSWVFKPDSEPNSLFLALGDVEYAGINKTTHSKEMPQHDSKKFIPFSKLKDRWSVSHMTVERLKKDPNFPPIYRWGPNGRFRFCRIDDVERYERASVR